MVEFLEYQNLFWNPNLHIYHQYLFLCHWCSRFRGRRRPPLPRRVAAPPLPRGQGSLPGASAPTSPAPAWPWLPPPAPRNPRCAGSLRPAALPPRSRALDVRPSRGHNTPPPWRRPAASGHPQNGINERALEAASGERRADGGARGGRRGLGVARGAWTQRGRRGRGPARPPVARCASPRRGPGGRRRRGGEGGRKRDPL